jgi:LDH2 family malate/lactate/ureidoglycolate dehydrogenase
MAEYPGTENERRIRPHELKFAVAAIFRACGMDEADALLLAGSLASADQRGIHSHGTLRVPEYVDKLTIGGVDPRGRPAIASCTGAALVIDAHNAMGQIAADFAMRAAIETARSTQVAIAAVRNSNHCGAMDNWAQLALSHDMIGIAATNALPTMAPWGGIDKIVGINPLAIAIPAAQESPIVLDIAFGATAHGKIRVYHQKGHAIPEGWAFDSEGNPTTDPAAAMAGLIQPIGGHKGIGLGIVMGILSTLLSGASYGTELGNMIDGPKPGKDGQIFAAINIGAFQPVAEFRQRVDAISLQIQSSRRRQGIDRLYPPGLLEAEFERRYENEGIPLNDETIDGMRSAARRVGITVNLFQHELAGGVSSTGSHRRRSE